MVEGISQTRRPAATAGPVGRPPLTPLLPLTLAEWTLLGLLGDGIMHGFGLVKTTAPSGELGRVWSVPTPVVYRSDAFGGARRAGPMIDVSTQVRPLMTLPAAEA